MRKVLSIILALAIVFTFGACGNSTTPAGKNETPTASNETVIESDAAPEFSFTLEDAQVDDSRNVKIEVKIRNNSDYDFVSVVFNGVILDENGEPLENCGFLYINGLRAGEAGLSSWNIQEDTTLENMASIKLTTVWYKDDPEAPSHNLRYDLSEPLVIEVTKPQ